MKKFLKTFAGKTLLIILTNVVIVAAACCVCATAVIAGLNLYTDTPESFVEEYKYSSVTELLYQYALSDQTYTADPDLFYRIYINGSLTETNTDYRTMQEYIDNVYTYSFFAVKDSSGDEMYLADTKQAAENLAEENGLSKKNIESYIIEGFYIDGDAPAYKSGTEYKLVSFAYNCRYIIPSAAIVFLIAAAFLIAVMAAVSARRPADKGFYPGYFYKVPLGVLLIPIPFLLYAVYFTIDQIGLTGYSLYITVFIAAIVFTYIAEGLIMTIAARIKGGSLFSNTIIWKFLKLIGRIFKALYTAICMIPIVPFTAATTVLAVLVMWIALYSVINNFHPFLFLLPIGLTILIAINCYIVYMLRKLEKGAKEIAAGNYENKIDTHGLVGRFRTAAENLNSLSEGMTVAVEEKLKSERMKTELITNVSHDIKTPLTSIINYSDLIAGEDTDNPKIKEYSEVLTRQSTRLKRLIEDLVEASKAQTGNLEINLAPAGADNFLTQTAGEYTDKLASENLDLVVLPSGKDLKIMADGRRMQRVFDNLMNNICKYSQKGTRVYLSAEEDGDDVLFTFRNTSKDQLNISPDELMERFVRGDKSRHTEGNGLGLSIAKSLTELQGGTMQIKIDADLFKVNLRFPKA